MTPVYILRHVFLGDREQDGSLRYVCLSGDLNSKDQTGGDSLLYQSLFTHRDSSDAEGMCLLMCMLEGSWFS